MANLDHVSIFVLINFIRVTSIVGFVGLQSRSYLRTTIRSPYKDCVVVNMPRFKILVPIKRVLDYVVKVRIKPDGSGFDLKNVKMSMNPFCEIAVEEAVRMRERELADEVVAVSVGPKKTIDTLRVALAIGADRAIQIVVPDDMPELQPLSVAQVLQLLVEREQPRLVLLGKQSIDGDNNQTGQMLAGMLDWPQVCFLSLPKFLPSQSLARMKRNILHSRRSYDSAEFNPRAEPVIHLDWALPFSDCSVSVTLSSNAFKGHIFDSVC